jgi:hypothetical protein
LGWLTKRSGREEGRESNGDQNPKQKFSNKVSFFLFLKLRCTNQIITTRKRWWVSFKIFLQLDEIFPVMRSNQNTTETKIYSRLREENQRET